MSDHTVVNQAFWDEISQHHADSEFYAVDRFMSSRDSLGAIERAEVGPVKGKSICHLQCHIGLDSLSLANQGATVTGLDFSAESVRIARELSAKTGIAAEFVQADVLDAAETIGTTVDLVFTTRGVVMWVNDLDRWADNCARLLHPGGTFYLLDVHPLGMVLYPNDTGFELASSYFGSAQPNVSTADASYAVSDVGLTNQETHEWVHPVGNVLSALAQAGLVIDFLHEHPSDDQSPTSLADRDSASNAPQLPALYSIRAHKPH